MQSSRTRYRLCVVIASTILRLNGKRTFFSIWVLPFFRFSWPGLQPHSGPLYAARQGPDLCSIIESPRLIDKVRLAVVPFFVLLCIWARPPCQLLNQTAEYPIYLPACSLLLFFSFFFFLLLFVCMCVLFTSSTGLQILSVARIPGILISYAAICPLVSCAHVFVEAHCDPFPHPPISDFPALQ